MNKGADMRYLIGRVVPLLALLVSAHAGAVEAGGYEKNDKGVVVHPADRGRSAGEA